MVLRLIHKLRKRSTTPYFLTGGAVHEGLAAYYSGKGDPIQAALTFLHNEWPSVLDQDYSNVESEVKRLLEWYLIAGPVRDAADDLRVLGVEQKFCIEVAEGVSIVGKLDLVGTTSHGLTVVDHKTARSAGPAYFNNMELGIQQNLYAFATREVVAKPAAFCLNVLVKTKEPRIERQFMPINWSRVERYIGEIRKMGTWLHDYFGTAVNGEVGVTGSLWDVPGNPGMCKHCPFNALCEYPDHLDEIIKSDYEVADYSQFETED